MKLRGALLGAGNIALRSHAPLWAHDEQLRDEIEIVAVADLADSNLAAIHEVLPGARTYTEAEALLERESLDFVDICTPPFTHRGLIERATAHGLHIVCEKPLAPSLQDAGRIARAVRGARVVFRPCHQYHYSPQWLTVRRLLPRLGRVHFAEYQVLRSKANEGNPNWSPEWRTHRALAGGGILVDHGAHIFYQLRAALGDPQTVQAAICRLLHHGYDVEDTALVTLDYGARLAHVSLTWASQRRAIHFRFVGECGELAGDDHRIVVQTDRTEEIQFDDGMSKNSWHSEWYTPLLREFSTRIREGGCSNDALEEAVHVTQVIERAYESSRVGRALPLDPTLPPEWAVVERRVRLASRPQDAGAAGLTQPPIEVGNGEAAAAQAEADRSARRSRRIEWLLRGATVAVVLAAAILGLRRMRWEEVWLAIRAADPRWIAMAAVLNLCVVGLAAARWLALLHPLRPRPRLRDAFEAMAFGFAVSAVVPARAGELARVGFLSHRTGLSKASVLGTIGLDQLINAAGLMVGLAVLPWLHGVPAWLRSASLVSLGLFALGVTALFALRPSETWDVDDPPGPGERAPRILDRIRLGLAAARSPRAIGLSLAASLAAWILEVIVMRVALRAVGIELPLSASVVVLMAVNVMLAAPVLPGNIGTLEAGAVLGLLGFGVAKEDALAFAICYHALQGIPIAILGFSLAGREGLARWPSLRRA